MWANASCHALSWRGLICPGCVISPVEWKLRARFCPERNVWRHVSVTDFACAEATGLLEPLMRIPSTLGLHSRRAQIVLRACGTKEKFGYASSPASAITRRRSIKDSMSTR